MIAISKKSNHDKYKFKNFNQHDISHCSLEVLSSQSVWFLIFFQFYLLQLVLNNFVFLLNILVSARYSIVFQYIKGHEIFLELTTMFSHKFVETIFPLCLIDFKKTTNLIRYNIFIIKRNTFLQFFFSMIHF